MRKNKFYNESTEDEILVLDVEDILFDEDNGLLSNNNRIQNINIVADDLYKDYFSNLTSEDDTNVNVLPCKSLSSFKMDLLNQEKKTLWMIVTGLYTVSNVNNLSVLNSPYIPGIKKISWNMKKLPEFGEEQIIIILKLIASELWHRMTEKVLSAYASESGIPTYRI